MRLMVVVAFVFAWVAAAPADAGYYLEHEAYVPNPAAPTKTIKQTVKTWREGRRFKRTTTMSPDVVVIDLDANEVVGFNPTGRTFWKVPADRYVEMALVALIPLGIKPTADGGIQVPDPLFRATGNKAVIEGRPAYELKVAGALPAGIETSVWLSRDVPLGAADLIEELKVSFGDPKAPGFAQLYTQWARYDGYPVQTVTTMQTPQGPVVLSQTLLKLERRAVPRAEFSVPKGYALVPDPLTVLEEEAARSRGPVGIGAPLKANKPKQP